MSSEGASGPRAPEARSDSVFGRMPLLLGEREYGTAGAHATCFAYAVATWCFLTGGYVAELVGAVEGLVCLVAGNLVGVFLTSMPLALACQRYGLEQIDACKPAFGPRGSKVLLLLYLINMLGWSGLILVMFGNGLRNIALALGYSAGEWLVGAGVALGLVLSFAIVTRGVRLLNFANSLIAPGIGLLVLYLVYSLLNGHGWQALLDAPALSPGPSPVLNYLIAFELGVASGFSWWGGIGFLARNTRTRRNSIYPEIIQLGLASGLVCSVGLFSALIVKSNDPTEWMVPLGGVVMGVLALAFVAFANVTSTAISIYASGLALRHLKPLRGASWRVVVILTLVPCLPFVWWPQELYSLGDAFLAYNGTMYAPVSGIFFFDYFALRGQRLSLWSIFEDAPSGRYYHHWGVNWIALAALLLGQVLYVILYNPISGETHELFRFVPASLGSFCAAGGFYGLGMRLLARRVDSEEASPPQLLQPNI